MIQTMMHLPTANDEEDDDDADNDDEISERGDVMTASKLKPYFTKTGTPNRMNILLSVGIPMPGLNISSS